MKTLQDCKDEVARKYELGKTLVTGHRVCYFDEASELYAQAYHEDKTRALTEHQFHIVWTAAVGMTGYDKVLFRELLDKLVKEEKVIPTPPKINAE